MLVQALGQMRRDGPSEEVQSATDMMDWPGKGDESAYDPHGVRFSRFSAPAWPKDCPRGSYYPTGRGAIAVSETPVLDPAECDWVVEQAEKAARQMWISDHSDEQNKGIVLRACLMAREKRARVLWSRSNACALSFTLV